jgi:phosphopantetheine adenylyltransferase
MLRFLTVRPLPTARLHPLASTRHFAAMPPTHRHSNRALLLLPPAPAPSTYAAIKAAYHAPLFTVLSQLTTASRKTHGSTLLDIALPCPHLYSRLDEARGPLYAATQQLVADLYKLICIVSTAHAIDTQDAEAIDARVILVAHPRTGQPAAPAAQSTPEQELQGPAIDIHTLARSSRPWSTIYSVESEEGEGLLKDFLAASPDKASVTKVRGGVVVNTDATAAVSTESSNRTTKHLSVAVGGTFDHLHIGHKLLLTMFAFILGRRDTLAQEQKHSVLTVGITGDALLQNKKYADQLESWKSRQEATHDFLSSIVYFGRLDDERIRVEEMNDPGPNGHAVHVSYPFGLTIKYVEIWDPFGPTITDKDITALALSLETKSGGAAVNDKRKEQGWSALEVYEVAVLDASEEGSVDETFQSKLSSTEIRRKQSELAKPRAKA